MYQPRKFYLGDIVETKKVHPCGSKEWEVIRVGADIKIKCLGCARIVMLPRVKFDKSVKKIVKSNGPVDALVEAPVDEAPEQDEE